MHLVRILQPFSTLIIHSQSMKFQLHFRKQPLDQDLPYDTILEINANLKSKKITFVAL